VLCSATRNQALEDKIADIQVSPQPATPAYVASHNPTRFERGRILVTSRTLPPSISLTWASRDALPLGGWSAPVPRPGTGVQGREKSFKQACNRLATCLQLPCNYGGATVLPGCYSGVAPAQLL
jgi:hypothetical protein